PRGVVITHGNLMHNQRVMCASAGLSRELVEELDGELHVSWLPTYHDMGLIGPVLNTIYLGASATLFSPLHFLQKPERWLTALTRYRAYASGGPNFAFELCLRHAAPEFVAGLDLSAWAVAFNGAEPVRATTLRRFAEAYAPAGFRSSAFLPCYGLAEATLIVSGGPPGVPPRYAQRPRDDSRPEAPGGELVGCGRLGEGVTVAIVDPASGAPVEPGQVGEIRVAGASVARGYWRNALATREVYRAALSDGRKGFLRTGDLGFLRDGELYVTGRLKDLIVIDGRNHYPQDLELSAESAHPALRPGGSAAFSVDDDALGEQPVIVAEAAEEQAHAAEEIKTVIRSRVGEAHGLSLRDVVLIRPGTIPKTSSGKIQRSASRAAYLDGTLAVVGASARGATAQAGIADV
ncbi:MAG: fatty acyl-AMP ligase, partial [Actinocrinis sp.]